MQVIATFNEGARAANAGEVGRVRLVLLDGLSKKSDAEWVGRTDGNRRVVLARRPLPASLDAAAPLPQQPRPPPPPPPSQQAEAVDLQPGDYVAVRVTEALSANTLRGEPLARCSLAAFTEAAASGHPLLVERSEADVLDEPAVKYA